MTDRKLDNPPKRELAQQLTGVLADSYLLYHTTQFCHWNIVGGQFRALHEMFEEQYRALAEAVDMIAERIRILGFFTPGTLKDYAALSSNKQPEHMHEPEEMLEQLIEAQETVTRRIEAAIPVAHRVKDEATHDLLVERLRAHQKATWMLKSQAGHDSAKLQIVEMDLMPQTDYVSAEVV